MSTPLRVVERVEGQSGYRYEPGDCFRCTIEQHAIAGRAPCWVVRLPGQGYLFHTNMQATGGGGFWTVQGEPPNLTVSPSINVGDELWHGHIKNGQLTPDTDKFGQK